MTASPALAIRIVVLYPEVMDVYADRGNLLAVQARCRTLGVAVHQPHLQVGQHLGRRLQLLCSRRHHGQVRLKRKGAALARGGLHLKCAAHQVDDLAADGQAQAGAAKAPCGVGLGLGEALEDALLLLGRDADAGVGNRKAKPLPTRCTVRVT